MKTTYFLAYVVFLGHVFLSSIPTSWNSADVLNGFSFYSLPYSNDMVLGVWDYSMTDIPAPYQEGLIFVTKDYGVYDVAVKVSTGVLSGEKVVVRDNRIHFNLNISGLERASFVLLVEGDRLIGEVYSANWSSQISAKRLRPVYE